MCMVRIRQSTDATSDATARTAVKINEAVPITSNIMTASNVDTL